MTSNTIFVENLENMPTFLISVIDSAMNTSLYSGIAWLISCRDNTIVKGTSMAGYPLSELLDSIRSINNAKALYLSTPPSQLFDDDEVLFKEMELAGIQELYIPKFVNDWWNDISCDSFKDQANIQILEYPTNNVGCQIYYGPYTLLTKKRPWVTCITTAHLDGSSRSLNSFDNDIGIRSHIKNRIKQSHALFIESGINALPFMSNVNDANGEIVTYTIESVDDFRRALKIQQLLQQSTVSLIASKYLMEALLKEDLIDDVVYYCMLFTEDAEKKLESRDLNNTFPVLKGWKITDSSPLTQSVRIHFSRILF